VVNGENETGNRKMEMKTKKKKKEIDTSLFEIVVLN